MGRWGGSRNVSKVNATDACISRGLMGRFSQMRWCRERCCLAYHYTLTTVYSYSIGLSRLPGGCRPHTLKDPALLQLLVTASSVAAVCIRALKGGFSCPSGRVLVSFGQVQYRSGTNFNTRKPCCRKETARCHNCSFWFKVCQRHSLQV